MSGEWGFMTMMTKSNKMDSVSKVKTYDTACKKRPANVKSGL